MNNTTNVENLKKDHIICSDLQLVSSISLEKSNILKNVLLKKNKNSNNDDEEVQIKKLTKTFEFSKPPNDLVIDNTNIINTSQIIDNLEKTNNMVLNNKTKLNNINKSLKKLKEDLQNKSKLNRYFAQSIFMCSPEASQLPIPIFSDSDSDSE